MSWVGGSRAGGDWAARLGFWLVVWLPVYPPATPSLESTLRRRTHVAALIERKVRPGIARVTRQVIRLGAH